MYPGEEGKGNEESDREGPYRIWYLDQETRLDWFLHSENTHHVLQMRSMSASAQTDGAGLETPFCQAFAGLVALGARTRVLTSCLIRTDRTCASEGLRRQICLEQNRT